MAVAGKILLATAGAIVGAAGFVLYRWVKGRGRQMEDLMPRIDVEAYNDALLAP
jgi:hypothetical protein